MLVFCLTIFYLRMTSKKHLMLPPWICNKLYFQKIFLENIIGIFWPNGTKKGIFCKIYDKVLNLNCKLELTKLHWDSTICSVDPYRSSENVTGCSCKKTPAKFKVATSISLPSTIDFDTIFMDTCENCADPVVLYVIIILGVWLGSLRWTTKVDFSELECLKETSFFQYRIILQIENIWGHIATGNVNLQVTGVRFLSHNKKVSNSNQ